MRCENTATEYVGPGNVRNGGRGLCLSGPPAGNLPLPSVGGYCGLGGGGVLVEESDLDIAGLYMAENHLNSER